MALGDEGQSQRRRGLGMVSQESPSGGNWADDNIPGALSVYQALS